MKKDAYLLMTDLHFAFRMRSRKNYYQEMITIFENLVEIKEIYQKLGYSVNLIILGDLFNRGINNASEAMQALEFFKYFLSLFDEVYAVIGNHEFTYYKNNPFWFLVSNIEDESVLNLQKKMKQPLGFTNSIRIVDRIINGEVSIIFNHYGVNIKDITKNAKINIGLFHQDIGSDQITKMWSSYEDIEKSKILMSYDYCFIAHLHSASGKYLINNKFTAYYLQSLGRANHTEVDDNNLMRIIPVIKIINGKLEGIDENKIELPTRKEVLNFEQIMITQKCYRDNKEIEQETGKIVIGNTLYESLRHSIEGTENTIIIDLLEKEFVELKKEYHTFLEGELVERGEF